jgi:extracellular matrix regulatory protein A
MVSVGYKNYISQQRIIAIISPVSRPAKGLVTGARERGQLVDATMGKKIKAVIITDSNHVVLSANTPDTITQRISNLENQSDHNARE